MRKAALFLLVLYIVIPASAQKTYRKSQGVTTVNEQIIDNGSILNAVICRVKTGSNIEEYGPDDITEYKLKDGRAYCSREITLDERTKQVFLEKMTIGATTLYFYTEAGLRTHFIETGDSGLVELPKYPSANSPGYRDVLRDITEDRPEIVKMVDVVPYNKNYLGDYITRYNNNNDRPFPHLRYGVLAGTGRVKFRANNDMYVKYFEEMDFRYQGGMEFGVFLDNPINHTNFSVHTELLFATLNYEHTQELELAETDFSVQQASLKMPVLIRYAFPMKQIRPFFNAGGSLDMSVKSDDLLVIAAISEPAYDGRYAGSLYKYMYGISVGGGLEIPLSTRNALFFEVRYSRMTGIFSPVVKSLKTSEIHLLSGINF